MSETKRHSLSHILAAAVQGLYPQAKFSIGPAIETGFYYDIDFGLDKISPENLSSIEKEMRKIISANLEFVKSDLGIDEALSLAEKNSEVYKKELLLELKKQGETIVSFYQLGTFSDLCRGPHVARSGEIDPQSFKLDKLAGAYFQGDEKKPMLTRIYGLAFENKAELDIFLERRLEAEKRDHRQLGKDLDLFHIDEKVGAGLPLWHPKGARLYKIAEDFWHQEHFRFGYQVVRTPHIGSRDLWETSGHWGFYSASMYPPLQAGQSLEEEKQHKKAKENEEYLLKPMNCPFHVQIFKARPKSYRDLPLRWAECGTVYRFEKKGELSGLTRVRGFTQDDAHIICRRDQVEEELKKVIDFIIHIFKFFGFNTESIKVYLSLRDPENKEKYAGGDEGWNFTEEILRQVAKEKKLEVIEEKGEAAFYGPKLDFKLQDCLGREWQCSTLQFDFNLPERFDMSFKNNQGAEERPYVLHRALFGSFERFLALLIEHYAGAFPVWLSPVQVKIISVGQDHIDYCRQLQEKFLHHDLRAEVDVSDETVGKKIRKALSEKLPYLIVIGDQEIKSGQLAVRARGEDQASSLALDDFIEKIKKESAEKR